MSLHLGWRWALKWNGKWRERFIRCGTCGVVSPRICLHYIGGSIVPPHLVNCGHSLWLQARDRQRSRWEANKLAVKLRRSSP